MAVATRRRREKAFMLYKMCFKERSSKCEGEFLVCKMCLRERRNHKTKRLSSNMKKDRGYL